MKGSNVEANRALFLSELRSGKYKKGTIKSDELGKPIIASEADDDGYCACAIMCHLFGNTGRGLSMLKATQALGISAKDCTYIQREINDTPDNFNTIADRIEKEVFNKDLSKIEVKDCFNCPFSSWSTGGHKGAPRVRLQHKCNLQKSGAQYRREGVYDCFKSCPLKKQNSITVTISKTSLTKS